MLFAHFLIDCVVDQPAIISNKTLFANRISLLLGWHHSRSASRSRLDGCATKLRATMSTSRKLTSH